MALLCKEEWRKPKSEGWNYVVKVAVEGKDVLGVKDESVKEGEYKFEKEKSKKEANEWFGKMMAYDLNGNRKLF